MRPMLLQRHPEHLQYLHVTHQIAVSHKVSDLDDQGQLTAHAHPHTVNLQHQDQIHLNPRVDPMPRRTQHLQMMTRLMYVVASNQWKQCMPGSRQQSMAQAKITMHLEMQSVNTNLNSTNLKASEHTFRLPTRLSKLT
ncbi:hypothetical protein SS1G_08686 [Sclerotinia sclerotiorum 1980 UF-70]|uniref:Uncharacterized protein n=1 Tax=Sclerotinia sclerotiorum (strain ATCC 18683 / 1980 / Ss-1) TaxID=665079 RepID=A7ETM9_SCLS1|nr:hypothetical protein SS1G_08686 [Sclerotinia sclerotiorum 1980 UF-70]EDN92821.1 hypothetical protein SS1G_08686 [Sclerotinia sclerotiorum 1980 UF-70]